MGLSVLMVPTRGPFMCYCKTNKGDLENTIAAAEAKGPQTASAVEEAGGEKAQLEADLKGHKADRASAKKSVADATALREKQAAEYSASTAELSSNSAAIGKAVLCDRYRSPCFNQVAFPIYQNISTYSKIT